MNNELLQRFLVLMLSLHVVINFLLGYMPAALVTLFLLIGIIFRVRLLYHVVIIIEVILLTTVALGSIIAVLQFAIIGLLYGVLYAVLAVPIIYCCWQILHSHKFPHLSD